MTSSQASNGDHPAGADGAFRAVGLAAGCLGVAALAAGTFVLSYQSIRAVALQAGIQPRYASDYPLLIDAMLVIALASVLALRGAGVPSRMLSWLTLVVVFCAAAGADVLHAKGRRLPHNTAVITAAVLPWALVFVAFVLLLAMLRHARLRRQESMALIEPGWTEPVADGQAIGQQSQIAPAPSLPVRSPQPWHSVSIVPGFTSQLVSSAAAGAAAGAVVPDIEPRVFDGTPDDSLVADTNHEATAVEAPQPVTPSATEDAGDETETPDDVTDPAEAAAHLPALAAEPAVQADVTDPPVEDGLAAGQEPVQAAEDHAEAAEDEDMPVFHRIWNSPTLREE